MKFGDKLIVLRKKNGLSQEELAEKLGVSRQSVSKWESNNTYPETDKIVQICNLFECSMDDLINDKVTDVEGALRKNKNNFNEVWDSLLEFITKTINMFSHMKFMSGLKCLIEMFVLGFLLWILGKIVCSISSSIVANLFSFFGSETTSVIRNLLSSIFNIFWFVLAVIVIIHTFKIRYLNYYEEITSDGISKDEEKKTKSDKKVEVKQERVVIRDRAENDKPFAFLGILSKIIIIFIKFLVACFTIGVIVTLVSLVVATFISVSLIPTNLLFMGSSLTLLSVTIITTLVLLLCIYFVISKKVNIKVFLIIFVASLITSGIGIGICAISFKNIDYITDDTINTVTKKLDFTYRDDLTIQAYDTYNYTYVIDSSMNDNDIVVEYKTNEKFNEVKYHYTKENFMNVLYIYNSYDGNFKEVYNTLIKDLKNNTLHLNYYNNEENFITIKANQTTIDKLITNLEKLYLVEKEVNENTIIIKTHGSKEFIEINDCDDVMYDARNDSINADDDECICKRKISETEWGERIIINCFEKEDFD